MEELNTQYLLLAFLGMVLHIATQVISRSDKEAGFSLKYWLCDKLNWVRIIIAVTSMVALLLMAEDVADVMGITLSDGAPAKSILAFLAGYLNHSLVKGVLKVLKKK
jgi:hypothetical protein|tara:strand:+ start:238 stop:558 length:321 start_codon:yes stop_codon:yes gene_type:complete